MYLDWDFINKYFEDNKSVLVSHHLESYNDFFNNGLKSVFKEKNPITILKQQDPDTKEFRLKCELFLGGENLAMDIPIKYQKHLERYKTL